MSDILKCKLLLSGGLGNQLFQFAFARALTLRSGARLVLDNNTFFKSDHRYKRQYELDAFCLDAKFQKSGGNGLTSRITRRILGIFDRNKELANKRIVDEPRPLDYYPEFASWTLKHSITLTGYWQCLEYFREFENVLREDLKFTTALSPETKVIADGLSSIQSVAVHVRRLDYGTTLPMDYYRATMERFRAWCGNARFYIFSDDPHWWLRNGENGPDVIVQSDGTLTALEEFQLMSNCRHFIMANSSFSWWAAWLGNASDKCIIAPGPEEWLNPRTIPPEWEIIS